MLGHLHGGTLQIAVNEVTSREDYRSLAVSVAVAVLSLVAASNIACLS